MCWASNRSFLCLRTRLARISAGSPTHNSKLRSPNKRSNQRECPVASIPHAHANSFLLQFTVELFGRFTVSQPQFSAFSALLIDPGYLLYAGVIVTTYNQHLRPPFAEPLVVRHFQVYSAFGGRRLYEIS